MNEIKFKENYLRWQFRGKCKAGEEYSNYLKLKQLIEKDLKVFQFNFDQPSHVWFKDKAFLISVKDSPLKISLVEPDQLQFFQNFVELHVDILTNANVDEIRFYISVHYNFKQELRSRIFLCLMFENLFRDVLINTDFKHSEITRWDLSSNSSPLVWEYGYKFSEDQKFDEQLDDLVPSNAELIERELEKPNDLTPDQLQEIRDLIAENRKLKEEMRKKREKLSQISNDLDSLEATESGDIQVEDKKPDSEQKLQTVQKQNDKPNKKSLLQRLLYHMRYNQILNIVTKTVTYLYIAFFLLVLLRFISSFLIVFFPGNNFIFALLLSLNYFVNYYLFDIGIIIFIVALIILFLNFLIYQKIQKILIAFSFGVIPILYFLSLISSTINQ